jgi:hypothetical protein
LYAVRRDGLLGATEPEREVAERLRDPDAVEAEP